MVLARDHRQCVALTLDLRRERVRGLATAVAERAARKDALYRTIGIKVVTPPYDVNTRAKSLPGPVEDADLVREIALELLEEFADDRARKLGVRVSNLSFADEAQADLGSWDDEASGDTEVGGDDQDDAADDDRDRPDRPRRRDRQLSLGEFESG